MPSPPDTFQQGASWAVEPAKAPSRSGGSKGLIAAAIVAGFVFLGAGAFLLRQQSTLSEARAEAVSLQGELAASKSQLSALRGELESSKARVTELGGDVADLNGQLAACSRQLGYSIRMDTLLNDKVDNVLYNRSVSEFYRLISRYNDTGSLWVAAANECDPDGDYTFD